jgi:hypothetical protein
VKYVDLNKEAKSRANFTAKNFLPVKVEHLNQEACGGMDM